MKSQMSLLGILLQALVLGTLLLAAVAGFAQNTLPNPHDDSCWSSLSALRACQTQAYDQAQDQAQDHAQRCTSYPEYQCNDYYQPPQKNAAKTAHKADAHSSKAAPSSSANQQTDSDNITATSSVN